MFKKLGSFLLSLSILFLISINTSIAQNISVKIVTDGGYVFPTYPTTAPNGSYRAYLEAKRNAGYGIRIKNHTDRRIAIVVTVDGRNIISGKKSYLRNTEKFYILNRYAEATYRGWRTSSDTINRFFFTEESNSYANAWGDNSAMGVIAVAAYAEKIPPPPVYEHSSNGPASDSGPNVGTTSYETTATQPARMRIQPAVASMRIENNAGTGYGREEHSSSRRIEFTTESYPLEKHFYKYEWRETLCRKNIISCSSNRLWPDEGYAPPPPR